MAGRAPALSPDELRERISAFISGRRLVLKEAGGETMPLDPLRLRIETRHGKVFLEVWDESRSVVRRIVEIRRESPGEMVLVSQRFGQGPAELRLLATSKGAVELGREVARSRFGDRVRKMLAQALPGWKVERLSAERDLERSFSARVTRAVLTRGASAWAVCACAEQEGEATADAALAQGLLWLDHLRLGTERPRREKAHRARRTVAGLKLLLPERHAATTTRRLPFLDPALAQYQLLVFSPDDAVAVADPAEPANLATALAPPLAAAQTTAEGLGFLKRLAEHPAVELVTRAAGVSCRIHGFEFARASRAGAEFGSGESWQPLAVETLADAVLLRDRIARDRAADAPDRHSIFYTARPERWLESLLARDIALLSGDLDPGFVYSQAPAIAGQERGVIDLLAVTREGRLAVIELKASADPNLPLQALDYWMRVKWHLERGEFPRFGYFPSRELRRDPPLLWLVAPAFDFHSSTDSVLRYLSPDIPITRIGLNQNWRAGIQVVDRR